MTRYTIYEPLTDGTGVSIFRGLLNAVFRYFGMPRAIVCDNGSEFRNNLQAELANYLGYSPPEEHGEALMPALGKAVACMIPIADTEVVFLLPVDVLPRPMDALGRLCVLVGPIFRT